ncbi:MAG: formylglycine-generating enzyme family protein [Magnetococcus sp. YQC-9]
MNFVAVTGARFEMGCGSWQSGCDIDEKPVHAVQVKSFWLGQMEVTQAQWKAVMGSNPARFAKCGDGCPVEQISWNDVQAFMAKINQAGGVCRYRLPTEAEWEYACRSGGKNEIYCGAKEANGVSWHLQNSAGTTHPGGKKQANGLGLQDMSGNVWEWTSDWYDKNGYAGAVLDNPQGPEKGEKRVIRGGSWHYGPAMQRSTARYALDPEIAHVNVGFRLVRQCP